MSETVKPHGRDCPDRCSQCLGAPVRVVTNDGPELLVDGERSGRAIDRTEIIRQIYARRGGRAKARRKAQP